jgi:SHS2 domain-containing protein
MSGETPPFEITEHTADVGIVARGQELRELFANAAVAMFHVVADLDGVAERESRSVRVQGHDWESLLVHWLNELLYYLDAEGLLFRRFDIQELEPYRLGAIAWGERLDPERHQLKVGIKGVTRHLLEVRQEDGGWLARLVLDI